MRFWSVKEGIKDWFPRVGPNILIIVLLASAEVVTGCGGTQPTQELCGSVRMVSGQPQVVVVLVDGIGSSANEDGSFYPVPVDHPENGKPMVTNYCPVAPDGQERDTDNGWPAGLARGLRKWSSFLAPEVPDDSKGYACEVSILNKDRNSCLVARLADAGAVLLPYSYTGATLSSTPAGPLFQISAYTSDDTKQEPYVSVKQLDDELYSIHNVWQQARIVIVAHSNGGMIAETWWECRFWRNCPLNHQPSNDPRGVVHVFSLDSPINGVEHCALAALVRAASAKVADQWCLLWNNRQIHDQAIINWDTKTPVQFTAVGTPHDPTYYGLTSGGGDLQPQVIYKCNPDSEQCIAQPPSYVSPCDGNQLIYGTTGHFVVRVCPQVVQLILRSVVAAGLPIVPTTQDVTTVDWNNFTYLGLCYPDSKDYVTVKNGIGIDSRSDGNFLVKIGKPIFGNLTGDVHTAAVVPYTCSVTDPNSPLLNLGGVFGHVIIFSGTSTQPVVLGEFPSFASSNSEKYISTIDSETIDHGMLQIIGRSFSGQGPLHYDLQFTAKYQWNGSQFVRISYEARHILF